MKCCSSIEQSIANVSVELCVVLFRFQQSTPVYEQSQDLNLYIDFLLRGDIIAWKKSCTFLL